mmetsp:Transcript_122899/g.244443  ORF Transcript_122899/g.244443 Transcript_122899/m.244443 type:complete len:223 (-) Transcript_122899:37-705(-)
MVTPDRPLISNKFGAREISCARSYEWLRPCEKPIDIAQRQGPLRQWRPQRPDEQSAFRPFATRSSPSLSAPRASTQARQIRHKRHSSGIWPAGSQGPSWQPPSEEEKVWRHFTQQAIKTAVPSRVPRPISHTQRRELTQTIRSSSCPSRNKSSGPSQLPVEETPGVEAWDSVSQVPSNPCTPGGNCTPQLLGCTSGTDRDVEAHLTENRRGWYSHMHGRMLG